MSRDLIRILTPAERAVIDAAIADWDAAKREARRQQKRCQDIVAALAAGDRRASYDTESGALLAPRENSQAPPASEVERSAMPKGEDGPPESGPTPPDSGPST